MTGPAVADVIIQAGTPEAVAFQLMEKVLASNPALNRREEILRLYAECLATVRGPVAEDLLAALSFED
jgi:hypothetical protein